MQKTVFVVATSISALEITGEVLLGISALIIILAVVRYLRKRSKGNSRSKSTVGIFIIAIALIISRAAMYFTNDSSSSIIITRGQITVSGPFIGNNTYTSGEIQTAFMDNIVSGNLTLSNKIIGTNYGNVNEGRFTLSNGATADDVLSLTQENLVIQLNSGLYTILGINNITGLENAFSKDVYHL